MARAAAIVEGVAPRRNAYCLAGAQAFAGAGAPVAIATGALGGSWLLSGDESLATLPVTGFSVGVAVGAIPAAALMRRVGRRPGFIAGTGVTALGGLVGALALLQGAFWLFAFGLFFIGAGQAFVQQYRFAATDGASQTFAPRAIGIVLAGGILAAIVGPQTVRLTGGLFDPVPFAGAFVGVIGLAALAAVFLAFLRVPDPSPDDAADGGEPPRPIGEIVAQPRFAVGLLCGVGSYALMSFIMTGAPLAMIGYGHSADLSTLGIQWHVLAMYGPSFVTGRLIARFGKETIVGLGLLTLIASAAVSLSGTGVAAFWTGLVLLGLGWNFGFIGSTAMVADTHRASEKSRTQGTHDGILFSAVALASFLSGQVYNAAGWFAMNWVVPPVAAICLVALACEVLRSRRSRRAAPPIRS